MSDNSKNNHKNISLNENILESNVLILKEQLKDLSNNMDKHLKELREFLKKRE